MVGKTVPIRYQYFEVCTFDKDTALDEHYDLRHWISYMCDKELEARVADTNGINGRLEAISVKEDNYYFLNMMRLDVVSNTYILEPDKEAHHVDLKENEYIGKNTVLMYDAGLHIVMIQCNRGSYGVQGIQNYINHFIEGDKKVHFRPVNDDFRFPVGDKERRYLKLDVRFSNIKDVAVKNNRSFEKILEVCNEIDCLTAHIEFGLGYTKGRKLEEDTIQGIIKDLQDGDNRSAISSAKITFSDDQKSELYSLFDNICNDTITYKIPARGELEFNMMAKKMYQKYTDGKSRAHVYSIINRR